MPRRSSTASVLRWTPLLAGAIVVLVPALAIAQLKPPLPELTRRFERLIEDYRTTPVDPVLDQLARFVNEAQADAAVREWLRRLRQQTPERADLQAALMMYSEAIMRVWARDDVYPEASASRYASTLCRFQERLQVIDGRSQFLRGWYLLWESFRHAFIHLPPPPSLDFLDDALRAFPDDGEILLAAGARAELDWWTAETNPHRDPDGSSRSAEALLVRARDYFRRGLERTPTLFELRLRLVRVLLATGDLDAAAGVAAGPQWSPSDQVYLYLARLFEGDLRERQGDHAAAARAYDEAIAQSPQPQSARIARAHLDYVTAARAEAAAQAIEAMSSTSANNDPWWVYNRGLVWHFDAYLRRLHEMVRR